MNRILDWLDLKNHLNSVDLVMVVLAFLIYISFYGVTGRNDRLGFC